MTKKERTIELGCSSPWFESEEDCKAFMEDIALVRRLEAAKETYDDFRALLYERFDNAGGDLETDGDVGELLRAEDGTEFRVALQRFDSVGGSPRTLWGVTAEIPADAFEQIAAGEDGAR